MSSTVRPAPRVVRRALWIAVAWAYVAALGAALIVAVTALVGFIVVFILYLLEFSTRQLDLGGVWSPAMVVGWIVGPVAIGLAIWVAAYGSTQRNSIRGGVIAVAAASVAGLILWFTGSLGIVAVALAAGWALAIPAEHPGRWLARMLPALVAIPLFPIWDGLAPVTVALWVLIGPLSAGSSVLVGDLGWLAMVHLRDRGGGDAVRAPSSLDV